MPKTRSGLNSGSGSRPKTDVNDLNRFFQHASDKEADAMLDRWKNEALDNDNRQQNTDSQRFFNSIGWADRTPEVLSEKEYQQALKDAGNPTQFYHSDRNYGAYTDRDFALQFMGKQSDFSGNTYRHFLSGGVFGDGTYFATTANDSRGYGTNQFRGFLNSKAKVVNVHTLDNMMAQYERQNPAFTRVLNGMTSGYSYGGTGDRSGLRSVFAAMMGYNVISNGRGYITVLDRSVVTVSDKMKRTTRGYMRNW